MAAFLYKKSVLHVPGMQHADCLYGALLQKYNVTRMNWRQSSDFFVVVKRNYGQKNVSKDLIQTQ